MNPTTEDQNPSKTKRPRWPKRIAITVICLTLLAGLASVAFWFYLRSDGFNRYVGDRVKAKLLEYGLRGEIGDFGISLDANTARMKDLKIYNLQTGQLIATVKRIEMTIRVHDLYALKLNREVALEKLALDGAELFVEIDEQGRTNLEGVRSAPPRSDAITIDSTRLVTSLTGGAIHVKDRLRKIETDLSGLKAEAQPLAGNPKVIHLLCKAEEGRLGYQGRETLLESLDLASHLSETGVDVEHAILKTGVGEVKAKGRLEILPTLDYALDLEAKVNLDEAARMLRKEAVIKGMASVAARIEGQATGNKIEGSLRSDEVEVAGAKLRNVQISGIKVDVQAELIKISGANLTAGSGASKGFELGQIIINGLKGTYEKGQTHLISPEVTVASLEWPESKIASLRLNNLIAGVAESGRYEVTADAIVDNGQFGELKFSGASAKTLFDNDALALNEFKANLFGGNISGNFNLPLAQNAPSTIKASFTGLQTKEASALFEAEGIPVAGQVRGEIDLSIIGSSPRTLNGTISTHFEGKASEATDGIPLTGDVSIRVQNGVFNFDQAQLTTDASKLTAIGKLSYDGDSDLRVNLTSSQAEQFVGLARSLEVARPFIEEYEPQLIGQFKFEGRIIGNLENPSVEGDVNLETAGLRDAILGALACHMAVSPAGVRVENATITAQNGGTLKFDLISPLDKKADSGRLHAVVDRINLETILAAVGAPSANQFISGDVTGEANLNGLPGSVEGTAQIRLVDGRIADQPAQTATVELRFEDKDAFLESLDVKLPQSRMTATGSMNLADYTFKLEGKADQIALENLVQALELQNTKIEGTADAIFDISGKAIVAGKQTDLDWESLKVDVNAEGQYVRVNDRNAGELKLTAHTSPGGRIEAELITGVLSAPPSEGGQRKTEVIKASIELRKQGRPIVIECDLANLDVSPLFSLFAPDLAPIIKGTITGKLRVEGPSADPQGNATPELLRGGLTLAETNLLVSDNPVTIETPATIAFESAQIRVPVTRINGQGVDLNFNGVLGLRENSPMNFSLKGVIALDRLPAVTSDILLFGTMSIDARADGTAGEPKLSGKVDIAGFGLSSSAQPIFITDGSGSVTLSGDQLTLDKFTANANEGTIEVSGVTKLKKLRPQEWKYAIKANNAEVILQEISGNVSGNLTLTGTPEGQQLTGTISIPQAEYRPNVDVNNLAMGGDTTLSFASFDTTGIELEKFGIPPVNLNIRVEARDSLIIRNEQINTIGSGALVIGGRLENPDTNGRITLDGGTLRFRGQRYEITTGAMDLPPGGSAPLLNLLAEGATSGYRVYIGLVGPIDDLDLTLRSEPNLARTEIISLITTGRVEAGTISNQDPLITGVGTAASLLTSGLFSRPAEQLLGLSRFQIDPFIRPNLNPAARLTVGQQLSRNFYLSYGTNLATEQDQTALAEYTLSNRFSALATYSQGGSATRQGLREGAFTIELRGRQRFSLGFKSEMSLTAGDPTEALNRIMRPKLPHTQVSVTEIPKLKLGQSKLRELLPIMNQGFSRSLARLGERRLTEYLQEAGYFFAEVNSRCEPATCVGENLKVFYDIEPNVIYDLKEIRIEGTDLVKPSHIEDYLQSKTANRLGGQPILKGLPIISGYVRGLTSSDRLKNDEEFIRNYLVDIGYRNTRVKSRLAIKPDNDDLIVIFDVDAGTQSEIAETAVSGNILLPAPDLLKSIPVHSGEAFSYTSLRAGVQQIKQLYAQRGFLEIEVALEIVELANDRVKVIYNVNEGARAVVSEIEIAGTTKTGKGWIQHYFDFKQGELLTPTKIRQTQRDLYSTNAFREVNVRAEPIGGDDGSAHKVTVNLTEAKPLLFVYGMGYSTDDGPRGLLELAHTNLGGTLNSLSLRLRGSRREQFSQLSFTDLRPFGVRFPTTISVFYNRNSNLIPSVRQRVINDQGNVVNSNNSPSFGLNRFAGFIQTERKIRDRSSLRFRYNLERASLFDLDPNFPETEVTRNERAIRLGMFSIGITRDTRDSVLNPTKGELVSADHSIASTMFGGNESFNKFFATYQRYKTLDQFTPLFKESTLAFSARVGLAGVFRDADRNGNGKIDDFEMDQRLPISERFFSGGATTLRGFRFETAGPQIILEPRAAGELPTLVPVGGDALALFNFELRYPLTKRLRLVPFYDLGNVFPRITDFRFGGMTNSVGMGLRINTPLGPVGVDYGFLIDPPVYTTLSGAALRQPRGAFHIRFGQTF